MKKQNMLLSMFLFSQCFFVFAKKHETLNIKKEEKMSEIKKYEVKKELRPSNLEGISDDQINDHWKLYEGYVKQVNRLNEDLKTLEKNSLLYADRRRRYGFEYNGMVLHEYYFENLTSEKKVFSDCLLKKAIEQTWGSVEKWKEDFIATGKTRGIGWAILYCDPQTKRLTNHFIYGHANGHIAGFRPILVMDVWEHAYMVDHNAGGRGSYIEAFMQDIDWQVVSARFDAS